MNLVYFIIVKLLKLPLSSPTLVSLCYGSISNYLAEFLGSLSGIGVDLLQFHSSRSRLVYKGPTNNNQLTAPTNFNGVGEIGSNKVTWYSPHQFNLKGNLYQFIVYREGPGGIKVLGRTVQHEFRDFNVHPE